MPSQSPFDLDNNDAYQRWREKKLASAPDDIGALLVEVKDPRDFSDSEYQALHERCLNTNMAIYASTIGAIAGTGIALSVGERFGLHDIDHNPGAEEDAVTALTVQNDAVHAGYIPYTNRQIHWHTDGYYNELDKQDHGLLLHCVRPAMHGGENALMDHEMAYLLMRDENPDYIQALMQPDVMMIPKNVVDGKEVRPDRSGPVFMFGPGNHLHMRYTMRKRNIVWKDEPLVRQAVNWLEGLLNSDSPYIYRATLQSGWGLVSNNVLHDRSAFEDNNDPADNRLLYRARYHDRIQGS